MMKRILVAGIVAFAMAACERSVPSEEAAAPPTASVVDSVFPMDVLLDRFRVDIEEPDGLRGGTSDRDTLVAEVIGALQASDTLAFEELAVDLAEWAWLYFPDDILSKPPYELPPGLAWFQLQETNRKGVLRALRELGGHQIDLRGYSCDPEPTVEGENRIWSGCRVTLARDGADPVTLRLFGAILERGGRFKILSYDNDF